MVYAEIVQRMPIIMTMSILYMAWMVPPFPVRTIASDFVQRVITLYQTGSSVDLIIMMHRGVFLMNVNVFSMIMLPTLQTSVQAQIWVGKVRYRFNHIEMELVKFAVRMIQSLPMNVGL